MQFVDVLIVFSGIGIWHCCMGLTVYDISIDRIREIKQQELIRTDVSLQDNSKPVEVI